MTHIDAQRAIYIDFECLQRQPPQKPHPALLGVLIGAADEDFEQLITDDRLAPARIANRERTRIVPAADAAAGDDRASLSHAKTRSRRSTPSTHARGLPDIRKHMRSRRRHPRKWIRRARA
jgi:hypothetical protein